ncbi:MAG: Acetyltransferase, family [Frankiales bacterium]|nr:Acetyltransferase, family [Frankiales bacterium]
MVGEVSLRPSTDRDGELLARIYASTRADELAALPWDDASKDAFVAQQHAAQNAHWAAHYAGGDHSVVQVDGVDAGRLVVLRSETDIRMVDIAILPGLRGQGVGTRLLADLLAEADTTGRTVSLHVALGRPAVRWYERLGFAVVRQHGADYLMERQPNTAS